MTLAACQRVGEPRAQDDEVADHPHQLVEARQVDAHVMPGRQDAADAIRGAAAGATTMSAATIGVQLHAVGLPLLDQFAGQRRR